MSLDDAFEVMVPASGNKLRVRKNKNDDAYDVFKNDRFIGKLTKSQVESNLYSRFWIKDIWDQRIERMKCS